jgi:hypothetical protein
LEARRKRFFGSSSFLDSRLPVKLRLLLGDVNRASELERGTDGRALALKALPCYLR